MTDEAQDQPVLSRADRALLDAAASPSDAQLAATRRAIGARIAALAAGAAVAQAASSAQASAATVATAAAGTAPAAASTSFAALGVAKWIGAGLLVTALASSAVVATRQARPAERSPHGSTSSVAQTRAAARAEPPAPIAARSSEPAERNEPAVAAMLSPAVKEPSEAPASAVKRTAQRARPASRPTTAVRSGEPAARDAGDETLSGELTLLHGARQALARGDASAALQALDAHATRYPNAMLRQEALSARALALCEAGRVAEARRTAAQLARLAPRSPHLIRLSDSCALADAADSKQ
jgi:hypothetical protein